MRTLAKHAMRAMLGVDCETLSRAVQWELNVCENARHVSHTMNPTTGRAHKRCWLILAGTAWVQELSPDWVIC